MMLAMMLEYDALEDIDDACIAPPRADDEPPARAEDLVRVREAIGSPVMADPLDHLAGKAALHIALHEIGDEVPQHRCRGIVTTEHVGEIVHRECKSKYPAYEGRLSIPKSDTGPLLEQESQRSVLNATKET